MRIALASSNGDIVDLHLGKAVSLVIYDVVDNDLILLKQENWLLIRTPNIREVMLFKNAMTVML